MANNNVSGNTFGNNATLIVGATINPSSPETSGSWLQDISQTDPIDERTRILESKGPFLYESFCWILSHEDFTTWRDTEKSGVFWIKGDPGKGKTMLLSGLIENFGQSPRGNINLTYFFCQASDTRINTASAIIRGLIFSFLRQYQDLRRDFYEKYKDKLSQLNGPTGWAILCDMFDNVTQHSALPNPVCVIDALDECNEDRREPLLDLIVKTSCRVKWLISSRNVKEIERGLHKLRQRLCLELNGNAEHVSRSVDIYINKLIRDIEALHGDDELQTKTTHTLKSKANGTFLWVALVVAQLRNTDHRYVEDVLKEMPEGLENLYHLILKRSAEKLEQKDRDACQILLSTITAAERPLRLEELLVFISAQWKYYETTYSLRDIQDMVKDCGSFLTIRENTVYFIHQSVKDFMTGAAVKIIFPSGVEYQHYRMFTTSINAMSREFKHNIYGLKDPASHIKDISPPSPDPLAAIAYCCVFWVEHLFRSCESGAARDKIFLKDGKAVHFFLKSNYICWIESLALLRSLVPQGLDAIQKLKILLAGHYQNKVDRPHTGEISNHRGERKGNHIGLFIHNNYQFIQYYKSLYLGKYINHAYTFFHHYDDSHLRTFVNDAYHFFHYCKDLVGKYPLQLYYSAIMFEDIQSAIYTTFQRTIRADFKNVLSFVRRPQRQYSLVQSIELNCRGPIVAHVYSPDSSFICSLSHGGTISLCRTDTCSLERVIDLKMDEKYKRRFSPNRQDHFLAFSIESTHLVSVSRTGTVQEWTVPCGTEIRKLFLKLNTSLVPCPERLSFEPGGILQEEVVALSHYGDLAASTCRILSGAVSSVKVWTIKTGECKFVVDQSHMPYMLHAAFSPDLTLIAFDSEQDTRVYSIQTREEIKHITHTDTSYGSTLEIYSLFSPDSAVLALRCTDKDIYLWCTKTWTLLRHIKSKVSIGHLSLSPNADISVLSCLGKLLVKSMDTGETLLSIKPHQWIKNAIFSPNWKNSSLLASFSPRAIQIWRADINAKDKLSLTQTADSHFIHARISPKSKFIAAGDLEHNITIWDGESGQCIQVLKGLSAFWDLPVFSPNLELIACVDGNRSDIRVWHVETGKSIHLLKSGDESSNVIHTAISDDSKYLVAGHQAGQARVWCLEFGKCLYENDSFIDGVEISRVAISSSSKYIALASERSNVHGPSEAVCICIWDWHAGRCISRIEFENESAIMSLAFSSDSTTLAVIIADSAYSPRSYEAKLYDVTSGARSAYIKVGESYCLPVFDPEKGCLTSDRSVFYETASRELWDETSEPGYSCSLDGDYMKEETWICFGGRKVFQIPREVMRTDLHISNNLLTFVTSAGELFIIRLHGWDQV